MLHTLLSHSQIPVERIKQNPNHSAYSKLFDLIIDNNGTLLLATDKGIYYYNGFETLPLYSSDYQNTGTFIGFYKTQFGKIYAYPENNEIVQIDICGSHRISPVNNCGKHITIFFMFTDTLNNVHCLGTKNYATPVEFILANNTIIKENILTSPLDFLSTYFAVKTNGTQPEIQLNNNIFNNFSILTDSSFSIDTKIYKICNRKIKEHLDLRNHNSSGNILRYIPVSDDNYYFCLRGRNEGAYQFIENKLVNLYNNEAVSGIAVDQYHNIWISTVRGGLICIRYNYNGVKKISFPEKRLYIDNIFQTDSNTIFLSDRSGCLFIFKPVSKQIKQILSTPTNGIFIHYFDYYKNKLRYHNGLKYYLVNKFEQCALETNKIYRLPFSERYKNSDGKTLLFSLSNVLQFDSETAQNYLNQDIANKITDVEKIDDNNYLIATLNGLVLYSPNQKEKVKKIITGTELDNLRIGSVVGLDNRIAVLVDNTIILIDYCSRKILVEKQFGQIQITGLKKYKSELLAITDCGYIMFDNRLNTLHTVSLPESGPQSKIISAVIFDSTLVAFTFNELFFIPIKSVLSKSPAVSRVWVDKFKYGDTHLVSFNDGREQIIKWKSNTNLRIDLRFVMENLQVTLHNLTYSIEFNDQWIVSREKIAKSEIFIQQPQPGEYKLVVNYRQQKLLEFKFQVLPPIHRSTWFITAASFALLLAIAILIYVVINTRQNKKMLLLEEKNKILELESAALLNQFNPHFIFNSLIPLQTFLLSKKYEKGLRYLEGFSVLLREMLEISRLKEISLSRKIRFIKNYIEQQQKERNYDFTFCIETNFREEMLTITHIHCMFIQPILENCLQHGMSDTGEKWIKIFFEDFSEDYVRIKVFDNGEGFAFENTKQEHHALNIIVERVGTLKKSPLYKHTDIQFQKSDEGFTVIYILPKIKKTHIHEDNRYHY